MNMKADLGVARKKLAQQLKTGHWRRPQSRLINTPSGLIFLPKNFRGYINPAVAQEVFR